MPGFAEFLAQAGEQFVLQVTHEGGGQGLALQRIGKAPLHRLQQGHAHPGAPAAGALVQARRRVGRPGLAGVPQQRHQFVGLEGQGGGVELQQVAVDQQAREVAGGTAAGAQPPGDGAATGSDESVEAGVEGGVGLAGVVVEHQPGGAAPDGQGAQQAGFVVRLQPQRDGQDGAQPGLALTATEGQPVQGIARGPALGALQQQHTLATAGGRAEQAQACGTGQQGLHQPGTGDMQGRQPGQAHRWRDEVQ